MERLEFISNHYWSLWFLVLILICKFNFNINIREKKTETEPSNYYAEPKTFTYQCKSK